MYVVGVLKLVEVRRDGFEQVVHGDLVTLHHVRSEFVLFDNRGSLLFSVGRIRNGCGGCPHQACACLFHAFDELFETRGVIRGSGVPVMDAEVEVNHVPFAVPQPDLDVFDSAGGGAAVCRGAVDVCDTVEFFADGLCVGS